MGLPGLGTFVLGCGTPLTGKLAKNGYVTLFTKAVQPQVEDGSKEGERHADEKTAAVAQAFHVPLPVVVVLHGKVFLFLVTTYIPQKKASEGKHCQQTCRMSFSQCVNMQKDAIPDELGGNGKGQKPKGKPDERDSDETAVGHPAGGGVMPCPIEDMVEEIGVLRQIVSFMRGTRFHTLRLYVQIK